MPELPILPPTRLVANAVSRADLVLEGVRGALLAKLLSDSREHIKHPMLVVTGTPESAEELAADMALFGASHEVYLFPPWDILPSETEHPDLDVAASRVEALKALAESEQNDTAPVIITPAAAWLQPTVAPDALDRGHLTVAPGRELAPETVAARLVDAQLEAVAQVDAPGQFCRRGGIMDVFPLFAEQPVRIEWFGDEIETVRPFDVVTQRSGPATEEEIVLIDVGRDCFRRAYRAEEKYGLFDHLPQSAAVMLVRPAEIEHNAELYYSGFDERNCPLFEFAHGAARMSAHRLCVVPEIEESEWNADTWRALELADTPRITLPARSVERLTGGLEAAIEEMRLLLEKNARITVFCHNDAEKQRLGELLLEKGAGIADAIEMRIGHISKGFQIALENDADWASWVAVGDHEIFGRYARRKPVKKRFAGAPIADFTELKPGDYVVHIANGIAKYEGIETLESNDTEQDYLTLLFADDARIYVPLSHVELVQRYVGSGERRPQLSKLGGSAWARRRKAAEKAVRDVAADLLRLQAVRKALPGIAYPHDDEMQIEFEASFPFEETPDQIGAIESIKEDQENPHPMDRLLCGDVGFGKTEVAVRAAFKVVNGGKQVAILVPTTILAEQHYRTFHERMADYPVRVECLSRFRSPVEQGRIVQGMKDGTVDIAIGTHRLLSQDIGFKDLGLVVIDEEQRFGVDHKERLKEMRASVDVLTMTATPIPRTLNMALLGLRDISNLTTAPAERQAIKTLVVQYNDELIRRAMLRELSRGGQCFFLHNRVQNIDEVAGRLSSLVPEARFGIGHGQMPEQQLLDVMTRFLQGRIDVLVCTTIIESGVDIPTVNTLFVNEADHFGLSELHQLRGRVGRYRNQAYAYFLVPGRRPINPVARKRLQALEEYSELGAGFRIAMRDLEIRGAGNVLGLEQSGHIFNIGFDLYCRLLEKAVADLKGENVEESEPVELDLGTKAFIPTEYIDADKLRIEFYRRLSDATSEKAIESLKVYARERYGPVPEAMDRLFDDQRLRNRARAAGINFLGRTDDAIVVGFTESGAKDGVMRLRTLSRKVTPMEGKRWRVALTETETGLDAVLQSVEDVLTRLTLSADELREAIAVAEDETKPEAPRPGGIPVKKPKLNRVGVTRKRNRVRVRTQQTLDEVSSKITMRPSEPAPLPTSDAPEQPDAAVGVPVIGLEPDPERAQVRALVEEEAFDITRFGTVTLVMGEGDARYWLRFNGLSTAPEGQASLVLKAESPDEVRAVTEAHLAHGGTTLYRGVIEEGDPVA